MKTIDTAFKFLMINVEFNARIRKSVRLGRGVIIDILVISGNSSYKSRRTSCQSRTTVKLVNRGTKKE